jgi:hypothetical protein
VALRGLDALRAAPDGPRLLCGLLAPPPSEREAWRWRARLLDRLRTGDETDRAFVLDVYEAAFLRHGEALRAATDGAAPALAGRAPATLEDALAIAAWWAPLVALRRAWPDEVRAREGLDVDTMLEGVRLHGLARGLRGGMA